ncbi:MAG: tetratricopeptide repeat protein, partial [Planctomycetota bacterium]
IQAEPLLVEQYGEVYAARTMRQMAGVKLALGNPSEAVRLARQALAMCEHAAEQEYIAQRARLSLGAVLIGQGDVDEARTHLNSALVGFDLLFGKGSLEAAATLVQLAWLELEAGNGAQGKANAESALQIRTSLLAPQHPEVLEAQALVTLLSAKDSADYFDQLNLAFETMERAFGPDHRESLRILRTAVKVAEAAGDSHSTRRFTDTLSVLEERRRARLKSSDTAHTDW